ASDKGHRDATALLGELTAAGQGRPKDEKAAFDLYLRAAEAGSAGGQYDLAYAYSKGIGVDKNQTEAARWYKKAAEGGDAMSQFDLAQRYELGLGLEQDPVEALKWYIISSGRGQAEATRGMQKLKKTLNQRQIAEASRRAGEFTVRK